MTGCALFKFASQKWRAKARTYRSLNNIYYVIWSFSVKIFSYAINLIFDICEIPVWVSLYVCAQFNVTPYIKKIAVSHQHHDMMSGLDVRYMMQRQGNILWVKNWQKHFWNEGDIWPNDSRDLKHPSVHLPHRYVPDIARRQNVEAGMAPERGRHKVFISYFRIRTIFWTFKQKLKLFLKCKFDISFWKTTKIANLNTR